MTTTTTTTIYICDICKNKLNQNNEIKLKFNIQVIFHTEQTEGRNVNPYLSNEKIDICQKCYNKVLEGNYIHGNGAQGCNNYYFRHNEQLYTEDQIEKVIDLARETFICHCALEEHVENTYSKSDIKILINE